MNKISVAIICGNIAGIGGTERAVVNLANSLAKLKKYQIMIVSVFSSEEDKVTFLLDHKVVVYHMKLRVKGYIHRMFSYRKLIRMLGKLIDENEVKIVIGTTHAFNCIITYLDNKVKKVGWEHVIYRECPAISRAIRRVRYRLLDKLVVLTEAEKSFYPYVEAGKKQVIYNAVSFDTDVTANLTNKRILYVGRLEKIKRVDLLIKASVNIKKAVSDWRIDIYGSGSEEQNIRNLIHENALEDYITIHKPISDIRKEYLRSGMIILTSRSEGLPMVLIEAQTCGLPIVSFDCPNGPRAVVSDGIDGYLVEQGNIDELAKRVIMLAKSKELREKMGRCAKLNSKRFSSDKLVNEWDFMLEKLLLKEK